MARKLGFSIEDLDDEEVIVEDPETGEVEEFAPAELEMGSDADVVEQAIDQVEEVQEGLESIKELMLASLADGGMSRETAAMANIAIANTMRRWGKNVHKLPSLEAFDDAGGRMQATGYALETIKSFFQDLWKKIKEFIAKWVQKAVEFYQEHLNFANRLEQKAESLISKVNANTEATKQKETTVSLGKGTWDKLLYKGGVDLSKIEDGLTHIGSAIDNFKASGALGGYLIKVVTNLNAVDLTDKAKVIQEMSMVTGKQAIAGVKKAVGLPWATSAKHADTENSSFLESEELIGGRAILFTALTTSDGEYKSLNVEPVDVGEKRATSEKWDAKALSREEIKALAKTAGAIGKKVREQKNAYLEGKDKVKDFIADLDKLSKKLDDLKDAKEAVDGAKNFLRTAGSISKLFLEPKGTVHSIALSAGGAAIGYAAKSWSNFEKPEKAKE